MSHVTVDPPPATVTVSATATAGPIEPTIVDRPHVAFGGEVAADLAAGLRREWLVTNGLGGYA